MEKTVTLFIANNELYSCRAIARYGRRHDYTLQMGESEELRINLPIYVSTRVYPHINLVYNPHMLDIFYARLREVKSGIASVTTLEVLVNPRDLGATSLGITYGQVIRDNEMGYARYHILNNPTIA